MPQENSPSLWLENFPRRVTDSHKYDFGHTLIFGAPKMTGATRLAAEACARIGAGLTTVIATGESANIYRETLAPHVIVEDMNPDIAAHFKDKRRNAVLIGPGGGQDYSGLQSHISAASRGGIGTVIDADGLNALAESKCFELLSGQCVLTPHEGEFGRLFPDITGDRQFMAREAARRTGAVLVLKGPETIIAVPDGDVVVNSNAPPNLATAGTGDVLAGMITGLLAQGMTPFQAACAAVWMHGEAACLAGPGLVAADLQAQIPRVLRGLGL
jgi:ADP-dependent NAD(P)H-hydrate dehydratase / NAD(P)H-hydrate epimerase